MARACATRSRRACSPRRAVTRPQHRRHRHGDQEGQQRRAQVLEDGAAHVLRVHHQLDDDAALGERARVSQHGVAQQGQADRPVDGRDGLRETLEQPAAGRTAPGSRPSGRRARGSRRAARASRPRPTRPPPASRPGCRRSRAAAWRTPRSRARRSCAGRRAARRTARTRSPRRTASTMMLVMAAKRHARREVSDQRRSGGRAEGIAGAPDGLDAADPHDHGP